MKILNENKVILEGKLLGEQLESKFRIKIKI